MVSARTTVSLVSPEFFEPFLTHKDEGRHTLEVAEKKGEKLALTEGGAFVLIPKEALGEQFSSRLST